VDLWNVNKLLLLLHQEGGSIFVVVGMKDWEKSTSLWAARNLNLDNSDLPPSKKSFFLMCSDSWAQTIHRSHSCQSDEAACHQHYNTKFACLHHHVTERRKETVKKLKTGCSYIMKLVY
jgi:hypothetical protein